MYPRAAIQADPRGSLKGLGFRGLPGPLKYVEL